MASSNVSFPSHGDDKYELSKSFLSSRCLTGKFESHDGTVILQTCKILPAKKSKNKTVEVLFLTGWNESYIKYWELLAQLSDEGYTGEQL